VHKTFKLVLYLFVDKNIQFTAIFLLLKAILYLYEFMIFKCKGLKPLKCSGTLYIGREIKSF